MPNSVQIGNILYFIPIILLIATCAILVMFVRKKGEKFADNLIMGLCVANLALHFLKQLMPGYVWSDWPYCFRQSTPENLCALLITLSPLLYKFGGKYMKDYLMVIGLASGLVVFAVPSGAVGLPLTNLANFLEVARFYLCHAMLIMVSVLIALGGFHKFSYKRMPVMALVFLGAQAIIVLNEVLLWASGIVDFSWEYFLSRDVRNASLAFGPPSSMDAIAKPLYWLAGIQWTHDDVLYFVPVLWMIPALIVFGMPFIFVITLPFTHKEVAVDKCYINQRLKMIKMEMIKRRQIRKQEEIHK